MNTTLKSLIQDSYSKVSMDHIAYEQPYMSGACVSTLDSITNDLARGGSFWLSLNNQSNADVQNVTRQDPLMGGISVLLPPHGNARKGMTIINPRSVDGMLGGATGKKNAVAHYNTFVECMTVPKETPTINAFSTAPGSAPSTSTLVSPAQQGRAEVGNIDNLSGSTFNNSQPITVVEGNNLINLFKQQGITFDSVEGRENRNISGTNTLSDHARGLALDFITGDSTNSASAKSAGDALYNYVVSHMNELHVKYVIWRGQITSTTKGTHAYTPPGGATSDATQMHFDHVHISFYDTNIPDFNTKYRIKDGKIESLVNTAAPKQDNATDAAKSAAFTTPKADVHFGGNGQSVFTGTDLLTPKSAFDMNWTPL